MCLPFFGPMLLISVSSVLATFNAVNPGAAILTLIQDAYLYVCFVMFVNLLSKRGDFRGLRLTWVLAASAIACKIVVLQCPFSPTNTVHIRGCPSLFRKSIWQLRSNLMFCRCNLLMYMLTWLENGWRKKRGRTVWLPGS